MRLGILADIHEEVEWLTLALERFHRERVDRVVVLGDVCATGERLGLTVELLRAVGPVGVWGNHDFGLCREPAPVVRGRYPGTVLEFMATLRPRLEVAGCLFSHVEPWLDPYDLAQLWYFEGFPDTPEKVRRSLDAWPHRVMFFGHIHRWLLATADGRLPWDGTGPVRLTPPERYLVGMAAVCNGWCAVFDTEIGELTPCDLTADAARGG